MSNISEPERVRDTTTARPNSTCMSLASARRLLEKASHPAIAHAGPTEAVQAAPSAKIVDRIRILTPSARVSNQFVNETLIFVGAGHEAIEETHAPSRTPGMIDVRRRGTHCRAGNVDRRPRGVSDESLYELRGSDRSAVTPPGILHVGEFGINHLVVSRAERHAPDLLARNLARRGESLGELVIIGKESSHLGAERDNDGAGQRGTVEDRSRGISLLRVPERVGKNEPSFGVRVDDLDRLARHGGD